MVKTVSGLLAGVIALSTFLAPGAGAEPAPPGLYSSIFQAADAVWIRKEDGGTFMYFAGAAHSTNLMKQSSRVVAWAERTRCAVAKTKHIKVIACGGRAKASRIPPEDFQFDPLMETARLEHKDARLQWKGQGVPQPWAFPMADPSFGAAAFGSVDRMAAASGTVLGTRMKGRRWTDGGYMSEGMYAFLMLNTPTGRYWIDPESQTVHYRFRFEVAH